jgi:exopolysaccharide biosynthesis polyprenyl glycosylphosphotransferase
VSIREPEPIEAESAPADAADVVLVSARTLEILERRRRFPTTGHRGWLVRRALLLSDVIGLALASLAAELLFGNKGGAVSTNLEFLLLLGTLPFWVIGAKLYGLYDQDEERTDHSTADEIVTVFHLATVGTWLLVVFGWASTFFIPNPVKFGAFWFFAILLVGFGRSVARAICRRRPEYVQNALIIGTGPEARLVARKLLQHPEYGINLVGFVADNDNRPRAVGSLPVLGDLADVMALVDRFGVDRVVSASDTNGELLKLARVLNQKDIQVDVVPKLFELVSPGVTIHTVEGLPLLGLPPFRLSRSTKLLKRMMDVVLSGSSLILLGPLFALVAVAIKMDSRGPVFFKQIRRGAGDELFSLYKFRTMVADAEERKAAIAHLNVHAQEGGDARMFKIERDPRVTRVGRILRHYLLDELPQLINVLKGDMSLVGPRPLIVEEDWHVEAWARKRRELKPGMTGLWQVVGRQAISFEEMVMLDYVYVTTWTFGGDLRLLLRTIPLVFKGGGGSY